MILKRRAQLYPLFRLIQLYAAVVLVFIFVTCHILNATTHLSNACSETTVADFYNTYAQAYHDQFKNRTEDDAFLKSGLDINSSHRLLDAGCGDGRFIKVMQDYTNNITGIDISDQQLSIAKTAYPQINFFRMDLRHLAFADSSFDIVVAMYSLIHFSENDAQITLNEFHRVLAPKGRLLIALQEGSDKNANPNSPLSNKNISITLYLKESITKKLIQAGFTVISTSSRAYVEGVELPYSKLYLLAEKK
jgi:ubiquinone/menaquinone biosynthesis C-methylase UbiE